MSHGYLKTRTRVDGMYIRLFEQATSCVPCDTEVTQGFRSVSFGHKKREKTHSEANIREGNAKEANTCLLLSN